MQYNKENTVKCYLCGNEDALKRPGSVRDNTALDILECKSCGLVFLSSNPNCSYEDSGMHGDAPLDIGQWIDETEVDDERRFQYLKSILDNRSLLDFGSGTGNLLIKAKGLASCTHGVELEKRLKNHYKKNDLSMYNSTSEIPDAMRKKGYDFITLFHVLEHLSDPRAILEDLSGFLAKDGQIIVEVPNANDALLTLYHSEPFSHFTYWSCHLFLFTASTLEMLAKQKNLNINYIRHVQRYPLSNHIYWLAKGKPGGHQHWDFLDSSALSMAYEKQLAEIGQTDTLLASFSLYSK